MPWMTERRMGQLRDIVSRYVTDESAIAELLSQVRVELGVDDAKERERVHRETYNARVREKNGGTTYTASDRTYYEKHKDTLKPKMIERQRRVRQAKMAASESPPVAFDQAST